MLEIIPCKLTQLGLSVSDVANYALSRGLKQDTQINNRLLVFKGPKDDDGNFIKLVIPSRDDFFDLPLRLAEAINLLAAVENRSSESLVQDIQNMSSNAKGRATKIH